MRIPWRVMLTSLLSTTLTSGYRQFDCESECYRHKCVPSARGTNLCLLHYQAAGKKTQQCGGRQATISRQEKSSVQPRVNIWRCDVIKTQSQYSRHNNHFAQHVPRHAGQTEWQHDGVYEAKVRAYKNNDSANSFYDISHWPTQSRNKAVIAVGSTSSSVWKNIGKVEEQVSLSNHQIKAKQDSKTSLISSITPCIINNIYRRKRQSTAAHISANNIRNAVDKAEVEGNGKQQTSIDESSAGVASKSILGKRQTTTDKRQTTKDPGYGSQFR